MHYGSKWALYDVYMRNAEKILSYERDQDYLKGMTAWTF